MRKYKDLTGKTFTYLTVVKETAERIKGAKVWLCKCKCGNLKKVKTDYLQQNWTKSCGCLKKENSKKHLSKACLLNPKLNKGKRVYKLNALIRSYKHGAKTRNLPFKLTDDEILKLVEDRCHYCGNLPSKPISNKSYVYSGTYNGIDRKDSKLGYITENVVTCCEICNRSKSDMGYREYIQYLEKLTKWRNGVSS